MRSVKTLADGTQVFSLDGFLFEHKARVNAALRKLNSQPRHFGPLGQPLGEKGVCGEGLGRVGCVCERLGETKWGYGW